MKFRIVLLSILFIGAFMWLTSRTQWGQAHMAPASAIIAGGGQLWSPAVVAHTAGLGSDELNNIDIYKMANKATVNITTTVYRQFSIFESYPARDIGSGFMIDDAGRILTNAHVIGGTDSIEVTTFDQKKYKARLLDRDPVNDLALIQIAPKQKLPYLRLGDSDGVQVGQKVLAIGNPYGLSGTLTTGVVSSLGRSVPTENGEYENMIQTDAAINPGNSGGPLLDSQGSVLGINTVIYAPSGGNVGIGFAIPINHAKTVLDEYRAGRPYRPPRLGVTVVPLSGDYAEALDLPSSGGLLIQQVYPDTSADRAGLHGGTQSYVIGNLELLVGGDLITGIDGKTVERQDALTVALARKRAGDTITLTLYRNGKIRDVKVVLGEARGGRV
jgi:S1-C subfamily serine protease